VAVRVRLLVLVLLLGGCAGTPEPPLTVASRHDPAFDFTAVETFAWGEARPTGDPRLDDLQLDARLQAAVGDALARRGLRVDPEAPDLTVWFYKALQDRVDVVVVGRGGGFARAQESSEVGTAETHVDIYSRGGLVLDLVDARTNSVVWRGRVTGRVEPDAPLERRDARLRRAVDELLAEFPPPPTAAN
jgi:hypothetical protein